MRILTVGQTSGWIFTYVKEILIEKKTVIWER